MSIRVKLNELRVEEIETLVVYYHFVSWVSRFLIRWRGLFTLRKNTVVEDILSFATIASLSSIFKLIKPVEILRDDCCEGFMLLKRERDYYSCKKETTIYYPKRICARRIARRCVIEIRDIESKRGRSWTRWKSRITELSVSRKSSFKTWCMRVNWLDQSGNNLKMYTKNIYIFFFDLAKNNLNMFMLT